MGRRIEKKVYDWDDQAEEWEATPSLHRKFVWGGTGGSSASGWLLLMELDGNNDPVRKYTWGLDLAGMTDQNRAREQAALSGAGGIGGLLAVYDDAEEDDYVYLYDANGNVGQLVAWATGFGGASGDEWHADRLVAHYEYDPYGNIVNDISGDAYAEENPFRFSTKYFHAEVGTYDYGLRPYLPRLGRWINRDPIVEGGGLNLYVYVRNAPTTKTDAIGLQETTSQPCCPCGPDITQAMIDHLNAFVGSQRDNLSAWPPTGAGVLNRFARDNGKRFWQAVKDYTGPCGVGPCKGTVTLCDLCMSGYHIDHILVMAYMSESYGEWLARKAGKWYEEQHPNPPDISKADLAFNELALCFARAMRPSHYKRRWTGDPTIPYMRVQVPADTLTRKEMCACISELGTHQREVLANKPGKGSSVTDYEDCTPCDGSITKPAGLELPPLDP